LQKHREDQKEKDYALEKYLKDRIGDVEVSVRTIKRNIALGHVADTSKSKEEDLPTENVSKKDESKTDNHFEIKQDYQPSPKISNAGLAMVWDELDQLRKKFDDFVHCEDFDEMADSVDHLYERLDEIVRQGGFKVEVEGEMEEEFTPEVDDEGESGEVEIVKDEDENEQVEGISSPSKPSSKAQSKAPSKTLTKSHTIITSPKLPPTHPKFLKKQSTTIKDLSPSKFSNFNRSSKSRFSRRNMPSSKNKLLRDLKTIGDAWPNLLKDVEELKEQSKINAKSVYKVGEGLVEAKKEFEDRLKKRVDSLYTTLQEEIKNLEAKIAELLDKEGLKDTIEGVKVLDLRVEKLNLQFEAVNRGQKDLQKRMNEVQEIVNSPFGGLLGGEVNTYDETVIKDLKEAIEKLNTGFSKLKTEIFRALKEQDTKLFKKVDEEVVNDLEEALHQGIDQVMTSSAKKFADRRDTNKAIRLLERNMKNMYDLFVNRDEMNNDTDDAMIAKKHLGFTCMS
jgi:chaperonin cofactor prefoldin